MNPGVSEEVGLTARSFISSMAAQPLSLALVVMNFGLIAFMFYSNQQVLAQRSNALNQIVEWQQRTDQLMASCVSHEVTKMMLDNMQRITETMLTAEQKEIQRMQKVIDQEREWARQRGIPPAPAVVPSVEAPK